MLTQKRKTEVENKLKKSDKTKTTWGIINKETRSSTVKHTDIIIKNPKGIKVERTKEVKKEVLRSPKEVELLLIFVLREIALRQIFPSL